MPCLSLTPCLPRHPRGCTTPPPRPSAPPPHPLHPLAHACPSRGASCTGLLRPALLQPPQRALLQHCGCREQPLPACRLKVARASASKYPRASAPYMSWTRASTRTCAHTHVKRQTDTQQDHTAQEQNVHTRNTDSHNSQLPSVARARAHTHTHIAHSPVERARVRTHTDTGTWPS